MTWVKIDDHLPTHPKVIGLSDKGFRLYVASICFSSANLTDGEIPLAALTSLGGTAKLATELVDAGLWDTTSRKGWCVHDYLHYNRSKLKVAQVSEVRREAGNKSAANRATNSSTNGRQSVLSASASADLNPLTLPKVPREVPVAEKQNANNLLTSEEMDEAVGRLCRIWEAATGTTVTRMLGDSLAENLEGMPEEWVADAIRETGLAGAKSWRYTAAILDRWKVEGREEKPVEGANPFKKSAAILAAARERMA